MEGERRLASAATRQKVRRYEAQLSVEALIGRTLGLAPLRAAILYLEPRPGQGDWDDLRLQFCPTLRPVRVNLSLVQHLLERAATILETVNAGHLPARHPACPDCHLEDKVLELLAVLTRG